MWHLFVVILRTFLALKIRRIPLIGLLVIWTFGAVVDLIVFTLINMVHYPPNFFPTYWWFSWIMSNIWGLQLVQTYKHRWGMFCLFPDNYGITFLRIFLADIFAQRFFSCRLYISSIMHAFVQSFLIERKFNH